MDFDAQSQAYVPVHHFGVLAQILPQALYRVCASALETAIPPKPRTLLRLCQDGKAEVHSNSGG